MERWDGRTAVLYIAPCVDSGSTDTATIDWFKTIDRDRFVPLLATTQPSPNRRLAEVEPYAAEIWALAEMLAGRDVPAAILDLAHSRNVQVVHIVNARIGFESLVDLKALPAPPKVVVQLCAEDGWRRGYARMVASRFGNLVDCFSVVNADLAAILPGYGVSPERIRTIPLGVDTQRFDPDHVTPMGGLQPACRHLLLPGYPSERKNLMLTFEIMRFLVAADASIRLHVVGDDGLEPGAQARAAELGLARHIEFHPPSDSIERWYAACELVLITDCVEGAPCALREAMAMRTPAVAPALPGNRELMEETGGVLINEAQDADAYAHAILGLLADSQRCASLGATARERAVRRFPAERTAAEHAQLYRELADIDALSSKPQHTSAPASDHDAAQGSAPLRFAGRQTGERPPVSVLVPCFNHGLYLSSCLHSILEQDYPDFEVIVVDDASTENSTIEALRQAESLPGVTVLWRSEKAGPATARNDALASARGRYILPVDSDDMLAPGAITAMVDRLQAAADTVGFVYPSCRYFGSRDDHFHPPAWNVYLLMQANFCDTASLFDRAIFDAGLRFPDDIGLGLEDWDFALTLAERGVRGVPAEQITRIARHAGFTRSSAVEYFSRDFETAIVSRHPALYGATRRDGSHERSRPPAADLKAQWAPALSILLCGANACTPAELDGLLRCCAEQSCCDFEVIVEGTSGPEDDADESPAAAVTVEVRRVPLRLQAPEPLASPAKRLQRSLALARGRYVIAGATELQTMLADPAFIERALRTMLANESLEAIAFTDAATPHCATHSLLHAHQVRAPTHTLLWSDTIEGRLPGKLLLPGHHLLDELAGAMNANDCHVQWRHGGAARTSDDTGLSAADWFEPDIRIRGLDASHRAERDAILTAAPALPGLPPGSIKRWQSRPLWAPPESRLLCRHVKKDGSARLLSTQLEPPPGYVLERYLGAVHRFAPPGTARLVVIDGVPRVLPRGAERGSAETELGHIDPYKLPLQLPLERIQLSDGTVTLAAGADDPLRAAAVSTEVLGYLEGYPNLPLEAPDAEVPNHGLVALLRCVDLRARRHRYVAVAPTDGNVEQLLGDRDLQLAGELGALTRIATTDAIEVRLDAAGRALTDTHAGTSRRTSPARAARWVGAPAGWSDIGRRRDRARAMTERAALVIGAAAAARSVTDRGATPSCGYLYEHADVGRVEIFAAIHPVTGDQLLTRSRQEAADLGYGSEAASIGFALDRPVIYQSGSMRPIPIPWASRFGLHARRT